MAVLLLLAGQIAFCSCKSHLLVHTVKIDNDFLLFCEKDKQLQSCIVIYYRAKEIAAKIPYNFLGLAHRQGLDGVVKSQLTSRWLKVVDNKRVCRNKPVERGRDTADLNPVSAQKGVLTFDSIYFSVFEGVGRLASDQPLLYYGASSNARSYRQRKAWAIHNTKTEPPYSCLR